MAGDNIGELNSNEESLETKIDSDQLIFLSRKEALRLLLVACNSDSFNICKIDDVKRLIELISSKIPDFELTADNDVRDFLGVYHCKDYEKLPNDILEIFHQLIFQYLGISGTNGIKIFGDRQWQQCESLIKERFIQLSKMNALELDSDTNTLEALNQSNENVKIKNNWSFIIGFACGLAAAALMYGLMSSAFREKAVTHYEHSKFPTLKARSLDNCPYESLICLKLKSSTPEKTISNIVSTLSFEADGEYEVNLSVKKIYNDISISENSQTEILPPQPLRVIHK